RRCEDQTHTHGGSDQAILETSRGGAADRSAESTHARASREGIRVSGWLGTVDGRGWLAWVHGNGVNDAWIHRHHDVEGALASAGPCPAAKRRRTLHARARRHARAMPVQTRNTPPSEAIPAIA